MPLTAALTVTVGRVVTLTLDVHNRGPSPERLEFPGAQQYEFTVSRPGAGAAVWRWGDDRMFAQATTTRTLAPGERWSVTEQWAPTAHGAYTVCGRITSSTHEAIACDSMVLP